MYYNDHDPPHFHAIYGEFGEDCSVGVSGVLDDEVGRC